ncbi:MAG: hypothetical protein QOK46_565, partial [Microbacteriaceae bacterium]|nr:hypothetical protein [Microbacteriaceae bacterium]
MNEPDANDDATTDTPSTASTASTASPIDHSVWGDESDIVTLAVRWSAERVVRHTDPLSTARTASELADDAGPT